MKNAGVEDEGAAGKWCTVLPRAVSRAENCLVVSSVVF